MIDYVGIIITIVFATLGWLWGRSLHQHVRHDEAVNLPPFVALFFGNPKTNTPHNIRGVYFQILSVWFLFPSLYFDMGLISSKEALFVFGGGLLLLPVIELLRFFGKKSK